ncbi:fluoride efflux transporter CrcB [Ancylobacter pratisalsi]|uniref:Fluoride-specific ion channel FluC n=1 Tax=Ancylobacter pratisalsi TaxID=1745854 RepID=A0A6P1YTG4_9HYPH|nr:fluoride efflux transporter CrcB [Ancylobacter pratisalsi]QIB36006.1 fluoride efflux transporter CrcB [Ancylobacter pratisalsi]
MTGLLLIFIGAGVGGVLRNLVGMAAIRFFGTAFPFGTFLVNVIGCFIIGCAAGWLTMRVEHMWAGHARFFIITGVLGGFTTFSSFSLDAAVLVERGELGLAALYVGGSLVLSLAAVFGGLALVRAVA